MRRERLLERLLMQFGETYSHLPGIDLLSREKDEIFKWFLASVLFGARITESIAIKAYRQFEQGGVTSPERIRDIGWDGLVAILDEGGYVWVFLFGKVLFGLESYAISCLKLESARERALITSNCSTLTFLNLIFKVKSFSGAWKVYS